MGESRESISYFRPKSQRLLTIDLHNNQRQDSAYDGYSYKEVNVLQLISLLIPTAKVQLINRSNELIRQ